MCRPGSLTSWPWFRRWRAYASGMTNVARNAGWAIGPLLGGSVMQHVTLAAPLFIGGALKIAYDLTLYRSFRHLRPPEEREMHLR